MNYVQDYVYVEDDKLPAVIVEPVAGSTGVLIPPIGYLEKLRKICTDNDIILIFDEVIRTKQYC